MTWLKPRNVLTTASGVIALGLCALVGLFLIAGIRGWQVQAVRSQSMAPAIDAGSLVVTVPEVAANIEPGVVIAFTDPQRAGRVVMHRVVAVRYYGSQVFYTTKGDSNHVADAQAVPGKNLVGRVRWSLPLVGGVLQSARTPAGAVLALGVPLVLLVGSLRNAHRRTGLSEADAARELGGRHLGPWRPAVQ